LERGPLENAPFNAFPTVFFHADVYPITGGRSPVILGFIAK